MPDITVTERTYEAVGLNVLAIHADGAWVGSIWPIHHGAGYGAGQHTLDKEPYLFKTIAPETHNQGYFDDRAEALIFLLDLAGAMDSQVIEGATVA